jgi:hypothetical protein
MPSIVWTPNQPTIHPAAVLAAVMVMLLLRPLRHRIWSQWDAGNGTYRYAQVAFFMSAVGTYR